MTEQTTEITGIEPVPVSSLLDKSTFEHTWRVAKCFAASAMVPDHFKNKPENCMVALMMSQQLRVDPLQCLQNSYEVHGKFGLGSSFIIGLANARGPFVGPLTWDTKGKGDSLEVTCKAVIKQTGEEVSVMVSMQQAKAAGWTRNPMYKSIPEQMLVYRSATWLVRRYCPEVLCGLSTDDEIIDITPKKMARKVYSGKQTESDISQETVQGKSRSAIDSINSEVIEADITENEVEGKKEIF